MAISPRELSASTAGLDAKVQTLEAAIDRKLAERPLDAGVTRLYDLPADVSQNVIDRVMDRYRAQGWEVTYHEGSANNPDCSLGFKYNRK